MKAPGLLPVFFAAALVLAAGTVSLSAAASDSAVLPPPPVAATPAAPPDLAPPEEEPASSRERARAVVREDRQFLQGMEGSEASRPAPAASAPTPTTPRSNDGYVAEATVRQFVRDYLDAAAGPRPEGELAFYGDPVEYFDDGRISRAAVARDQQAYYRRWPERQFTLTSQPEVLRVSADGATVRFRIRYEVRRGASVARGNTENVMRLQRQGDRLLIVAIRERKLD